MSNGIIQRNGSAENYMKDPAMQETPIADHLMISNDQHTTDESRDNTRSIEDGKTISNETLNEHDAYYDSSPLINKNGDKNVLGKDFKGHEIEHLPQSPLRLNRRTPDIDKIANFFRNNRTPNQKKLLAQFDSSATQDTPISQRRDYSPLRLKSNEKITSTDYMKKLHVINDEPSLEVTEADIECKLNTSNEGKPLESQAAYGTTNRLNFFDQGTQPQETPQTHDIQRVKSFHTNNHQIHKHDNEYHDESHVNNTTDGDISVQWVFKSNKNDQANSNKSTQMISTGSTQKDEMNNESQKIQPSFTQANEGQTQVLASLNAQEISMDHKKNEMETPVQIVRSPERNMDENVQEIPSEPGRFSAAEITTEVPGTSPLFMSRDIVDVESGASSPRYSENSVSRNDSEQGRDCQGKVLLQISSKPELLSSLDTEQRKEENSYKNTAIVVSETELTQDLPELEEQGTLDKGGDPETFKRITNGSFEESQEITKKTRKRSGRSRPTVVQEEDEEEDEVEVENKYRNLPKKKLRSDNNNVSHQLLVQTPDTSPQLDEADSLSKDLRSGNRDPSESWLTTMKELPQDVRKGEEDFLSKRDIKFEDAVWCQYDLNYCFYPGRLISYDEKVDGCWVVFETGQSLTKNDDIYYLDIRVGDTVNWNGKVHKVVALERKTQDPIVIRCIRGYDTVYLKKRNISGKLGKKVSIVSLSSISLDLNEWTKRPKVILEEGSHTRAKAFKFLQHPIRGRKSITNLSPRKSRISLGTIDRLTYKEDSDEESSDSMKSTSQGDIMELSFKLGSPAIKEKLSNSRDRAIFKDCLFILSGLNEEKYELSEVIESLGGTIIDMGFSDLFDFEFLEQSDQQIQKYTLELSWKSNINLKNLKFGCLLSTKHLRSLKYLESLALGWPVLHWKFIERCISDGKLCQNHIPQYLLPSGESFRLNCRKDKRSGVVKSNDIFQFYFLLLKDSLLKDQVGHNYHILSGYVVLIFGHSGLDQFIKFILACLGVKIVFQISGKIGSSATIQNLNVLTNFTNNMSRVQESSKIIIYINSDNALSNTILEEVKETIWRKFVDDGQVSPKFHLESKEWLIQTLINGSTGFD